jgi:23S rRNA (cytosine1962-C5)-methyltransferase
MWTFDPDTRVDDDFVAARVAAAAARRAPLLATTDTVRLVFGEADGLPGVVVDRFADVAVVQIGSPGGERWRDAITAAAATVPGITAVYERSDGDGREREGLAPRTGPLAGPVPQAETVVHESGLRFAVDVAGGQKTGFYIDQRDARAVVASVANGRRVLNAFSYTGAFTVVAAAHGATEITNIDSSGPALALGRRNAELNGTDAGTDIEGDAFAELRRLRDRARSYDLVILDPPKLAPTEAHVERASRAYKDLNLLAAKLLAPGGILMTFSCSAGMTRQLFQQVVAGAALDAGRDLHIVGRLGQPADHPVPLAFPEADYLKGLVLHAP